MKRKVSFEIFTTPDQKQEWRDISEIRRGLDRREHALIESVKAHPKIDMAKRLGGYDAPEVEIKISRDGASFAVSFFIKEIHFVDDKTAEPPQKARPSRVHLDPKTLNLLLNSKILTDEQKVALLCRIDDGLGNILKPAPAEIAQ